MSSVRIWNSSPKLTALAGGALVAFSMPPWGWWPAAFVGLGLFDLSIRHLAARARLRTGMVFGAAWYAPSTLWMWDLSPPGYFIAGVLFAVLYGVGAVAVPAAGWGRSVAMASAITVVAAVRWSWPFGGVPLATLAMSQVAGPLAPTVRLFGSLTLVALAGLIGSALANLAEARPRQALAAVAVVVVAVVGARFAHRAHPSAQIEVAIVQGGGPQNTRAINTSAREVFDRHVEATEQLLLGDASLDLVLWPEDVVHSVGPIEQDSQYVEMVSLARKLDAPLIAGIIESFRDDGYFLNASIVIAPDGKIESRYDKLRRVPFGEYVPLRSIVETAAPDFLASYDALPGSGPAYLDTEFGRLATAISWEIFHDDRVYSGIQDGAQLILNPTNGSSFWLTMVQTQQVASSRLRAIENDRFVLQAAPTGFSAVIEPDGSVIDRSAVSEAKVIRARVELREGRTWATRFGQVPMIVCALLAWLTARVIPIVNRRRSRP